MTIEAQVFCDLLFRAFGYQGFKEAGATLEEHSPLKKHIQIKDTSGKVPQHQANLVLWHSNCNLGAPLSKI